MIETPAPPMASKMPQRVHVELTTRCNLRCRYCSHTYSERGSQHDIEPAVVQSLEELLPYARDVELQGTGESLLYPGFNRVLGMADAHGCQVTLITNGMLLTPSLLLELAVRGCQLIVSVDGACAETHEWHRPGASFEWLMNILGQWKGIKASQAGNPRRATLLVHLTLTARNILELPAMANLVASLDGDGLFVSPVRRAIPDDAQWNSLSLDARRDEATTLLRDVAVHSTRRGIWFGFTPSTDQSQTVTPSLHMCPAPWRHLYLAANGDVFPCCQFGSSLGNCRTDAIATIWHGPAFQELRARFSDDDLPPECRRCVLPWRVSSSSSVTLASSGPDD